MVVGRGVRRSAGAAGRGRKDAACSSGPAPKLYFYDSQLEAPRVLAVARLDVGHAAARKRRASAGSGRAAAAAARGRASCRTARHCRRLARFRALSLSPCRAAPRSPSRESARAPLPAGLWPSRSWAPRTEARAGVSVFSSVGCARAREPRWASLSTAFLLLCLRSKQGTRPRSADPAARRANDEGTRHPLVGAWRDPPAKIRQKAARGGRRRFQRSRGVWGDVFLSR